MGTDTHAIIQPVRPIMPVDLDLLSSLRQRARKKPIVLKNKFEPPDALVLCIIEVTCACGEVYRYPSRDLMVRRKEHIFVPKEWNPIFRNAPHEEAIHRITAQACEKCFGKRGLEA